MSPGRERTPAATGARRTTSTTSQARSYRYPGQRRALWEVLSDIRRRHWWRTPELTIFEAEDVWWTYKGADTTEAALGRLVFELHEHGRLQRVDRGAS